MVWAVVAGLLSAAALPGSVTPYVAWIAPVFLCFALRGASPRLGLILSWLSASLGFTGYIGYAIYNATTFINDLKLLIIPELFYEGLPYAAFGWICCRLNWLENRLGCVLAAATLAAFTHLFPAMVPGDLSLSMAEVAWTCQAAEWFGSFGLQICLYAAGFLAGLGLMKRRWAPLIAAVAIPLALSLYGGIRLWELERAIAAEPRSLTVGLMNTSDTGVEGQAIMAYRDAMLSRARAMAAMGAHLVVWTESSPFVLYGGSPQRDELLDLTHATQSWQVVSATAPAPWFRHLFVDSPGGEYRGMHIASPDGDIQLHIKRRLFPGAEINPLIHVLPAMRHLVPPGQLQEASTPNAAMHLEGLRIIGSLCYEIDYSDLVAEEMGGEKADLLINQSSEIVFGDGVIIRTQLAHAVLRAVEFRIPVIRSTNGGISSIIDATGRIVTSRTPRQAGDDIVAPVSLFALNPTPYSRIVKPLPWIVLAGVCGAVWWERRRREPDVPGRVEEISK